VSTVRRQKTLSKRWTKSTAYLIALAESVGVLDQGFVHQNRIRDPNLHVTGGLREHQRFSEDGRRKSVQRVPDK
jgi:hypothetical protein